MQAVKWIAALAAAIVLAGCTGKLIVEPDGHPATPAPVPDTVGAHTWVPFASASVSDRMVRFADNTSGMITAHTPVQGVMAIGPAGEARGSVIVVTVDGVA